MTGPSGWLRGLEEQPHARRWVVCFPHAGGSASFFRSWRGQLPADVGVLAIQYPGHEDRIREPCRIDVAALADPVAAALGAVRGEPLVLFGHSMGATVAYEVARRLASTAAPHALAVSGHPAPRRGRGTAWHLTDDDTLWSQVRRLSGTADQVLDHPELRAMLMPVLRNDYRISEQYRPAAGPLLRDRVLALIGGSDPEVTDDEARGWSEVSRGPFTLRVLPGGHFYLVPQQAEVVRAVLGLLDHPEHDRHDEEMAWPPRP